MKLKRLSYLVLSLVLTMIGSHSTIFSQTTIPTALRNPTPIYPPEAADLGFGGEVIVHVRVDKVGKVKVLRAFGPVAPCSNLEDTRAAKIRHAAVEATKLSEFVPALKNGKPTEIELTIQHRFDDKGKPVIESPAQDKIIRAGVLRGRFKSIGRPNIPGSQVRGVVPVAVLVDFDGRVLAAAAMGGPPPLHFHAADAACRSIADPVLLDGKPVRITGTLSYNF